MSYLQDNTAFLGTGERDGKGKTLQEFLDAYDPKKYDCPSNTVDIAVFAEGELLLIRRGGHPNIGMFALPGGFVELREDLETAAARELMEETGVRDLPLVQVRTFGAWDRDPRWRVITTLYAAVLPEKPSAKAGDDAADAVWFTWSLRETPAENGTDLLLSLTAGDRRLSVKATRVRRGNDRLWEYRYVNYEADGIAADHGILILEAVRRISEETVHF